MLGPVCAGLMGTVLPAAGYMPALGLTTVSADPVTTFVAWPGIGTSIWLSVFTGFAATAVSLACVALLLVALHGTWVFTALQRVLSPLLAVPHAAAAFGLAFLIAPSGWIARALSPWGTGGSKPPDLLILNDPAGLSLIAGLVVKEVPFLVLMSLAALSQIQIRKTLAVAKALGHARPQAWAILVFPHIYRQIRLPVYVVLAFSMSVVDVAIILGPGAPPTLAVQILRWMGDPDLTMRSVAAVGAVTQLALVIAAVLAWRAAERCAGVIMQSLARSGRRGRWSLALPWIATPIGLVLSGLVLLGIAGLAVWSIAGFWSFPNILPDQTTWRNWSRFGPNLLGPAITTMGIALAVTTLALLLVLGCLEAEERAQKRLSPQGAWLLYLPLLVPQIAFLPGIQTTLLQANLNGGVFAVILVHSTFVLPYVYLSLADIYHAVDPRLSQVAYALGRSPAQVFVTLRLPILLAPILTAFAVGFAVSVGQYLPTLLIGGGRVTTLTTEAVALAAGADRRAIGATGLAQTAAALVPFALATLLPALVWANRKGLRL